MSLPKVGTLLALLVLMIPAGAQSLPDFLLAGGVSYDRYAEVPSVSGFGSLAIKLGSTPVYSFSTLELMSKTATLRTGAGYLVKQSGNFSLIALGDGGIATGGGVTLSTFSGGGMLAYQIKKSLYYVMAAVRIRSIGTVSVQPVFEAGFARGF